MRCLILVASMLLPACGSDTRDAGGDAGERPIDGNAPDAREGGPGCDTSDHTGCGDDELCCEVGGVSACVRATPLQCTACGVGCAADGANACVDRSCACGFDAPCSGDTPFCEAKFGMCRGCRGSADCASGQCVTGQCVGCDPADASGCSGTTPICNPATFECEPCTSGSAACPPPLTCTSSGACAGCDPTTHAGCAAATSPICDPATTSCRACETDAECIAARGAARCLTSGRCADCDPVDDSGCSGVTPVCREAGGAPPTCDACASDGECAARPGTPVCADSGSNTGACVECDFFDRGACTGTTPNCDFDANRCIAGCTSSLHCTGTTPICDGGTCRGCAGDDDCALIGRSSCAGSGECF